MRVAIVCLCVAGLFACRPKHEGVQLSQAPLPNSPIPGGPSPIPEPGGAGGGLAAPGSTGGGGDLGAPLGSTGGGAGGGAAEGLGGGASGGGTGLPGVTDGGIAQRVHGALAAQ
jgi:hypothetical protein